MPSFLKPIAIGSSNILTGSFITSKKDRLGSLFIINVNSKVIIKCLKYPTYWEPESYIAAFNRQTDDLFILDDKHNLIKANIKTDKWQRLIVDTSVYTNFGDESYCQLFIGWDNKLYVIGAEHDYHDHSLWDCSKIYALSIFVLIEDKDDELNTNQAKFIRQIASDLEYEKDVHYISLMLPKSKSICMMNCDWNRGEVWEISLLYTKLKQKTPQFIVSGIGVQDGYWIYHGVVVTRDEIFIGIADFDEVNSQNTELFNFARCKHDELVTEDWLKRCLLKPLQNIDIKSWTESGFEGILMEDEEEERVIVSGFCREIISNQFNDRIGFPIYLIPSICVYFSKERVILINKEQPTDMVQVNVDDLLNDWYYK